MTLEELKLLRLVQGILVRNYVDTQKLDIDVTGGTVHVEGDFHVFEYHPAQKGPDRGERERNIRRVLMMVDRHFRNLTEVHSVEWKLRNWQHSGSDWLPVSA